MQRRMHNIRTLWNLHEDRLAETTANSPRSVSLADCADRYRTAFTSFILLQQAFLHTCCNFDSFVSLFWTNVKLFSLRSVSFELGFVFHYFSILKYISLRYSQCKPLQVTLQAAINHSNTDRLLIGDYLQCTAADTECWLRLTTSSLTEAAAEIYALTYRIVWRGGLKPRDINRSTDGKWSRHRDRAQCDRGCSVNWCVIPQATDETVSDWASLN